MAGKFYGRKEIEGMLQKAKIVQPDTPRSELSKPTPKKNDQPVKSMMINPMNRIMYKGSRNIVEPNRKITYRILRTVAEKAWIINLIISHQIDGVRPFLRYNTDKTKRGFQIVKKETEKMTAQDEKLAKYYASFFEKTGFEEDQEREDSLDDFIAKLIRDKNTLDQVTTEIQKTIANKPCAYWAIDPATVVKVAEGGYNGDDAIKYIQEVDNIITAYYTKEDLIFDFQNPRTDINYAGYGYSVVEQAVDLVTGMINAFAYNAGFFTEDRLPRGMLLLQGDADMEEVEMIEDYLINTMSGNPANKWHIPIIPAGDGGKEGGRKFEWVSLQGSNKDMEYGEWTDRMWSGVAGLFGVDLEELGIKTQHSTAVIAANTAPRLESSRSRWLNSTLSFIEAHLNRILEKIDDRFKFEFVGYERDDPNQKNQTIKNELETFKTIDEIRVEQGYKPFNEDWSKVVLNPQVTQLKSQAQQQAMMGGGMGGAEEGDGEGSEGSDSDYFGDEDEEYSEDGEETEDADTSSEEIEKSIKDKKSIIFEV